MTDKTCESAIQIHGGGIVLSEPMNIEQLFLNRFSFNLFLELTELGLIFIFLAMSFRALCVGKTLRTDLIS